MIEVKIEGILPVKQNWLKEFVEALSKQVFKPNFTKLSKDTGKSVSSIFDFWSGIEKNVDVDCFIILREKKNH